MSLRRDSTAGGTIAFVTTVLIVDDHDAFRVEARKFLESIGYSVVAEAADGASAVETARRLSPDVILLDVALPDIDGFIVARRLVAAGSSAKVILISTRDARDYGGRISSCGAVGFIAKADLSARTFETLVAG